jgi:GAF domain-containing protein
MTDDHRSHDGVGRRDLAAVLVEFAQLMAGEPTTEAVLDRLGAYCTELLSVDGVGVMLADGADGLVVGTANSELGRVVEELEVELGEGPCTHAVATGQQIPVPDLRTAADRYPRFVPAALEAGVAAIHALPMAVGGEIVGSLDVVKREPGPLALEDLATAQLLADVGISYIANSRLLQERSELADQLQRALDSRVVLEQAKGVLSERHGIDLSEAFERIRAHARSRRRKVGEVSREVLSGELEL